MYNVNVVRLDQCFPTILGLRHPTEGKYNLCHPIAVCFGLMTFWK